MPHTFAEIAFTPTVKHLQTQHGSRASYARWEAAAEPSNHRLTATEVGFIAARDSVYVASVSETGWPYMQHRGGPPGFVKVLDDQTLGFADFRGNRQYISLGNWATNDRVSLFFMDYANQRRLKLFGHVAIIAPEDRATLSRLDLPDYPARVERGIMIRLAGFDWNCPQHITERFTRAEVSAMAASLTTRIAELEAELAARSQPPGQA